VLPEYGVFRVGLAAGMLAFSNATVNYAAPVLSREQAVLGVPELGLKAVTRSTSVGYPLCREANNKKYFFGDGDSIDVTTPEAISFFEKVDALESLIKQGYRPQFVCRDFLKDEVRKEGKNARLIAGTDLSYYTLSDVFWCFCWRC
jgi:hypothetical protein